MARKYTADEIDTRASEAYETKWYAQIAAGASDRDAERAAREAAENTAAAMRRVNARAR